MKTIKSKFDAAEFAARLKAKDISSGQEVFRFYYKISNESVMTKIFRDNEGDFYSFSSGSNWQDQEKNYIGNIKQYIWDYRKEINYSINEKNKGED